MEGWVDSIFWYLMYLYSRFIHRCRWLFWQLLYLHCLDIHCCRCSFGDQRICNLLFFELADTFHPTCHIKLHLHLAFSWIWGYFLRKFCICIPHFLWPADASHWNYASSTCSFYNLQMHPAEITHLQFHQIHYRRYTLSKWYIHNARPVKFYYLIHQACDNVL